MKYDEVGNRTASEVNGEKATFTYNDANQLRRKMRRLIRMMQMVTYCKMKTISIPTINNNV